MLWMSSVFFGGTHEHYGLKTGCHIFSRSGTAALNNPAISPPFGRSFSGYVSRYLLAQLAIIALPRIHCQSQESLSPARLNRTSWGVWNSLLLSFCFSVGLIPGDPSLTLDAHRGALSTEKMSIAYWHNNSKFADTADQVRLPTLVKNFEMLHWKCQGCIGYCRHRANTEIDFGRFVL